VIVKIIRDELFILLMIEGYIYPAKRAPTKAVYKVVSLRRDVAVGQKITT
jgi:hypothetical protein